MSDGTQPASSPYVVWTPYGNSANGTIIVSCGTASSVFVNQALGEGEWMEIATPEGTSYSRSLRVLQEQGGKDDGRMLLLMGAGHLPPSTTNRVTDSLVDLGSLF